MRKARQDPGRRRSVVQRARLSGGLCGEPGGDYFRDGGFAGEVNEVDEKIAKARDVSAIWERSKERHQKELTRREKIRAIEDDAFSDVVEIITEAPQEHMSEIAAAAKERTWPEAVLGPPPRIWDEWMELSTEQEVPSVFEIMQETAEVYLALRKCFLGVRGRCSRSSMWKLYSNLMAGILNARAGLPKKDREPMLCKDREKGCSEGCDAANDGGHDHHMAVTAALAGLLGAAAGFLLSLVLLLLRGLL